MRYINLHFTLLYFTFTCSKHVGLVADVIWCG